ncbi:MAG: DUF72 domain-containing protein [Nitrososphaerales archaeon]
MDVRVGCCGQAGLSLARYAELVDVIELQSTFYRLPRIETALRWREMVPDGFEFTVKAFQGVTHLVTSPTWRRAGGQKPTSNLENYGHLQQTEECLRSWSMTLDVCRALEASFCVVQMPPSFAYSEEHLDAIRGFFGRASGGVKVGLELRHKSWSGYMSELDSVLEEVGVVHIVDPLKEHSARVSDVAYFRLHGLGHRLYRYTYTDEDLKRLKRVITDLDVQRCYMMFNNLTAKDDSLRFKNLLF